MGVIIVDEFGGMDICKGRDMCRRGREGGGVGRVRNENILILIFFNFPQIFCIKNKNKNKKLLQNCMNNGME